MKKSEIKKNTERKEDMDKIKKNLKRGATNNMSKEEKNIERKETHMKNTNKLKNGVVYKATLKNIKRGYEYGRDLPTVDFIYKVHLGLFKNIEVKQSYNVFDNRDYRLRVMSRLANMLYEKFDYEIFPTNCHNEYTIIEVCKPLIGTAVELEQYTYAGKNGYRIISASDKWMSPIKKILKWKKQSQNISIDSKINREMDKYKGTEYSYEDPNDIKDYWKML